MSRPLARWSQEDLETLKQLLRKGKTHAQIACALNTSVERVKNRVCWDGMSGWQRELKRQGNNRRRLNGRATSDRRQQYPISASKPKPELLEDAARRLLAPRTLTGELMGDPPIGYSALERRT